MYSYLTEQLVNTPDSNETKFLKEKYPELIAFVALGDKMTADSYQMSEGNVVNLRDDFNLDKIHKELRQKNTLAAN